MLISADEAGGGASTIYRGPEVRKVAPSPTILCMFLSFLVVSLSTVQINFFRTSPSHSATDSQSPI